LVEYGFAISTTLKTAVVLNAIGCGVSVGSSLATGTFSEMASDDPGSAAATAFGCLTMTVSGAPGTVAGTVVSYTLNGVALAACGWGLYQAVKAEDQYFADLKSGNTVQAEEDYQKAISGLFGTFVGCEISLASIALP
jgi:hypothetical protein